MNENYLVRKSNYFIMNSSYDLSLQEQKIILTLASMVQLNDEEFKPYRFNILDFINLLGIEDQSKYTEVPRITKELMKKVFEIKENNKIIQVAWLCSVLYEKGSGYVELVFSPYLKPYMLQLNTMFTQYKLINILSMKSKYSPRIYELLKCNQFKKQGYIIIEILVLRQLLKTIDIYPLYADFKRYVILQSQKELKKLADIGFEFEEIKTGRKVTSLKFYIYSNVSEQNIVNCEKVVAIEQPENFIVDKQDNNELAIDIDDLSDKLRDIIEYPLKIKELKEILISAGNNIDIIKSKYALAVNQIENKELSDKELKDWLIWAIKNDYKEPEANPPSILSEEDLDDNADILRTFIKEPLRIKDFKAILIAANNDVNLVKSKYIIAKTQEDIDNITAWLISAVKNDYKKIASKGSTVKNKFCNYEQRDVTEYELLSSLDMYLIKEGGTAMTEEQKNWFISKDKRYIEIFDEIGLKIIK